MSIKTQKSKNLRFIKILEILENEYPQAGIELSYKSPFQLLVATILSAQCTDVRVNIVTKTLFKKFKKPQDFLDCPIEELEQEIFSTGFYKAKAKNIRGAAKMIIERFGGKVPETMDELLTLPGVGRKTANVVLGHCFGAEGIVVDTHVSRLSNRLGFAETNNAEKIEFILMDLVPKEKWTIFTHYLISHGRKVCASRKPKCEKCVIEKLCPASLLKNPK